MSTRSSKLTVVRPEALAASLARVDAAVESAVRAALDAAIDAVAAPTGATRVAAEDRPRADVPRSVGIVDRFLARRDPAWRRLRDVVTPADRWLYRDAHYLAAEVDLDAVRAARWVPWPLRLAEPARATVFTAWFPHTSFGSVYREAGVFLHVRHRRGHAIHSPWMLVDDDVALIAGRELLGYPKKLGEFRWEHDGDRITAVARRRGHELVRMEARLGERVAEPPPMLGRPHRNVRTVAGIAIPKLIAFTPRERIVEVRRAELALTIGGSERDPLHEMGFGRVIAAHLHRVDLAGSLPPVPIGIASPIAMLRQLLPRSH